MKKLNLTFCFVAALSIFGNAQEKAVSATDNPTVTVLKQKNPKVVEEYIVVDPSKVTTQKSQNPFYKKEETDGQSITTERKKPQKDQ